MDTQMLGLAARFDLTGLDWFIFDYTYIHGMIHRSVHVLDFIGIDWRKAIICP